MLPKAKGYVTSALQVGSGDAGASIGLGVRTGVFVGGGVTVGGTGVDVVVERIDVRVGVRVPK